jgi:FKBP-type peptidyl-prolyl cis-trans isomerase
MRAIDCPRVLCVLYLRLKQGTFDQRGSIIRSEGLRVNDAEQQGGTQGEQGTRVSVHCTGVLVDQQAYRASVTSL